MKKIRFAWLAYVSMAMVALAAIPAHAQDSQAERMRAALASPERAEQNRARDEIRRPVEVIRFLGIEDGDSVLDVIAAGGWYTEVLSAAVGPDGTVYSQNPEFFLNRPGFAESENAMIDRLGNIIAVHGEISDAGIDGQMDAAITALNVHDIYGMAGEEGAAALLSSIYDSLKPGGVFGLIDHRGIAGQPNGDYHRLEESIARDLLTQVGFVIEDSSNLLANSADDHMRPTRHESLAGRSDRFLLRARKP